MLLDFVSIDFQQKQTVYSWFFFLFGKRLTHFHLQKKKMNVLVFGCNQSIEMVYSRNMPFSPTNRRFAFWACFVLLLPLWFQNAYKKCHHFSGAFDVWQCHTKVYSISMYVCSCGMTILLFSPFFTIGGVHLDAATVINYIFFSVEMRNLWLAKLKCLIV